MIELVFFDLGDSSASSQIKEMYDMVIIGGGPAGLTAAIYASRGGLDTLVIEKSSEGGQIAATEKVENYPGFTSIDGLELAERFSEHAKYFGASISNRGVKNITLCCDKKTITLDDSIEIAAKTIVIATGATHRKLNVPGEKEYEGKGVSYCAICDGAFFRDKHVAVIGGGNSAIDEGLYLTQTAAKVTVVHRRNSLRADRILQERAFNNPKMDFIWDAVVEEIQGDAFVNNLLLKNVKDGTNYELQVDGVFIYVGLVPNSALFKNLVQTTPDGFIKVNPVTYETTLPGVFAVGDVIDKELRQIINAAADGASAAASAIKLYF